MSIVHALTPLCPPRSALTPWPTLLELFGNFCAVRPEKWAHLLFLAENGILVDIDGRRLVARR
jgi:hypothetical protein